MTVLTTLTYMVCALIERWALNDMVRKGPWKEYAVLAVVTFLVRSPAMLCLRLGQNMPQGRCEHGCCCCCRCCC